MARLCISCAKNFKRGIVFCCFGKLSSSILLYSFAWSQRGRLAAWKSTSSCCGILYDFSLTHTHRAMSAFPLCPADMLSCAAHFPLMWKTEYINVGQSYRLQSTCLFCWNRLQLLFMLSHTSARSFEWNAVEHDLRFTVNGWVSGKYLQSRTPSLSRLVLLPDFELRLFEADGLMGNAAMATCHPTAMFGNWKVTS